MLLTIDKTGHMATLHSRPTGVLMALLPGIEGRRQWVENRTRLRFEASGQNLGLIRGAFPDIEINDKSAPVANGVAYEFELHSRAYESKTPPYAHQRAALAKAGSILDDEGGFGLFMEQGTGKTKVAIDLAGRLHAEGKIDALLILAKKGVHRQWIDSQIPIHFGGEWSGAKWPTPKRLLPDDLLDPGPLKVFAINWDGAKTKAGKEACLQFVQAHRGRILIVGDETQEIKNQRSARWKAAKEIASHAGRPYRRMALTGTPIAKDLTDEWAQLLWADESILGIRYATSFRNEYCVMGGFEGKQVIGHRNMERFRSKVDPVSFRATKDELGILPKSYRPWRFDLTKAQRALIAEIRTTMEGQIESGEIVVAANAAVGFTKIQQISNGFAVDEDGNTISLMPWDKNPRMLALREILDAHDGQTIVWARFRHDIREIRQMLDASGISAVEYHGGTSDAAREENVDAFLSGKARVFVSNPQAGGTGLNLQTGGCNHAIYYSNSYNAIDRWQSEDRIHRIGTVGVCAYTDLIAKGSIDAGILSNLRRKQGIADMAIGDIRKLLKGLDDV